MARKIYKFALDLVRRGTQEVKVPKGARVMSVGLQASTGTPQFVVWAEVDPEAAETYAFVRSCETGDDVPESPRWRFVNTVQVYTDEPNHVRRSLVWHFYVDEAGNAAGEA